MRAPRPALTRALPRGVKIAGRRLRYDPAALRLLFGYVGAVRNLDLNSGGRAGVLYQKHILDSVLLALGAEGSARTLAEEHGARSARSAAILREIDRRSSEQNLSAAEVGLRLGITPRYVHLLLEATGKSFTHHLLEKRLQKAAALLCEAGARDRKIGDIAVGAGFNDFSYFSRAFRRRFEATPSDMREAARRDDSDDVPDKA